MYIPILKNRTVEMSVLTQLAKIGVFSDSSIFPLIELIQEKTRSNNKNTFLDDLAELLAANPQMSLMIDFLKSDIVIHPLLFRFRFRIQFNANFYINSL